MILMLSLAVAWLGVAIVAVALLIGMWLPAIAMEARQGGDGETRPHAEHDSAGPQDIAQGKSHD